MFQEIISSFKKEDKAKIIAKYKIGDIIKNAEVKVIVLLDVFSRKQWWMC